MGSGSNPCMHFFWEDIRQAEVSFYAYLAGRSWVKSGMGTGRFVSSD